MVKETNPQKKPPVFASQNKPLFIVFEGLDGSGKSTQIRYLAKRLQEMGRKVYITAEPTTSTTGGLIRDALNGSFPRTVSEMAGLFLADRIAHNASPVYGIRKFLSQGMDVICDRYYYSSFAYQGVEQNLNWVMESNLHCPEIIQPDLCLFLDVDPDNCQNRMEGRPILEIYEDSLEKLQETRNQFFKVFDKLKDKETISIVDATRTEEEVAEDIFHEVCMFLGGNAEINT